MPSTPTFRFLGASCLATVLAVSLCSPLAAQVVDPDPELFDGTRTKKDEIPQEERPQTDKWTEANLILYDSDEEGSEEGGQGRVGGQGPGFADGVQVGVQGGLPIPMMGGGAGSGQPSTPGMIPMGQQSSPTPSGQSSQGTPPAGAKPGEVGIGDSSQKIAAAAQPVSKISGGGTPPPPAGGEPEKSKGEDTTTIPSAASGPQGGKRGGGVEKGDAMPTDI